MAGSGTRFLSGGGGASSNAFILADGTINPASLDGSGNVRAVTGLTNAIGFNSITPDQNNTTLARELRFDSSVNNTVISDKGSTVKMFFNNGGVNDITISSLIDYVEPYLYRDDDILEMGYDSLTSNETHISLRKGDPGVDNLFDMKLAGGHLIRSIKKTGAYASADVVTNSAIMASRNSTVNTGILQSLILGGSTRTANKSNYVFVQNLEIQTGIGLYTADPTLNGSWGDRAIPDRAYVDSKGTTVARAESTNITAVDRDFVLMTTGATDKTVTLPAAASNTDAIIEVKKVDAGAGNVIIDGNGAETIDDATTQTIIAQYQCLILHCDGTEWWIK